MKVLMFGWEFPPHISGGLGTACYGLTKGLANFKDIEVLFVVPKAYGDEDQSTMKLIGAGDVPVTKKKVIFKDIQRKVDYFEVDSLIIPIEPAGKALIPLKKVSLVSSHHPLIKYFLTIFLFSFVAFFLKKIISFISELITKPSWYLL